MTDTAPNTNPYESPDETTDPAARAIGDTRVWPGALSVALLFGSLTIPTAIFPESPKGFYPLQFGVMASYLLFVVWWLGLSRLVRRERLLGFGLFVGCMVAGSSFLFHSSLRGPKNIFPILFFIAPYLLAAVVAAMLATKPFGWKLGRWATLLALLTSTLVASSVRFEGTDSNFKPRYMARWQQSTEERLLSSIEEAGTQPDAEQNNPNASATWPGFRGSNRNGHVEEGALAGDWNAQPPKELWRRDVGPGWSSFCIAEGLAFTQEQRGEQECVIAYNADTGAQVWLASIEDRFYNAMGGAGPRATPSYYDGSLYVTGATGAVHRLNASTGEVIWQKFLVGDEDRGRVGLTEFNIPPMWWGFASSPLVIDDGTGRMLVLINVNARVPESGDEYVSEAVIALDIATGELVWQGGVGTHGYSSPHLATLQGVRQILMVSDLGLESLDPQTGKRLWFLKWVLKGMNRSIQPLLIDDGTVALSGGYDSGTMLIDVANNDGKWTATERWKKPSRDLVPYFNDIVLHKSHIYGISKKFLVCIDLETGKSTWPRNVKRKSKVGNGQLVLDAGASLLLVTDENSGEVLIVEANPETLVIRSKLQLLSDDICWNHPVVVGGRLYVRNSVEAACYELPQPKPAADPADDAAQRDDTPESGIAE